MSSVSTSTIVYASIGTAATGLLAYALYFDYKRRNDADFRKALKRESRKQAKAAQVEAEAEGKKRRQQIRALVDEVRQEGLAVDAEEKEQVFMQEVGRGEALCQDESSHMEAAVCFFKALSVYPQPDDLMNVYDKTVPKPVLDILAEMVAYDRMSYGSSRASSAAGGVE